MTEPYIGAMFKREPKPAEFGVCDLCDRPVESEATMELSQIRFRNNLCGVHFREAKDDATKITAAIDEKRARAEKDAQAYDDHQAMLRAQDDLALELAERVKLAEAEAFEAERERIRKTKEFFDG